MENKLYVILHPHTALIASQLSPEKFALHYTSGPSRYYTGKVIFAELDAAFRHPFFPHITEILKAMRPHSDGRPKATKYIKTYRVLEHLDLSKLQSLYLTHANGSCLKLCKEDLYTALEKNAREINFFAEISPIKMLTISRLNYKTFGQHFTNPLHAKGAPGLCYTTLNCDAEKLISNAVYANKIRQEIFPEANLEKLKNCILLLKKNTEKKTKGILLEINFSYISYKHICNGITLCGPEQMVMFAMPSLKEIKKTNLEFYKSL